MRRLTAEIIPRDGGLHPTDRAFLEAPEIERVRIDHLNYLTDGTGVMMYCLRGDRELIEEILDETDEVLSYSILPAADGHQVYIHFEVAGLPERLLRLANGYEVVIDFPIECTERGIRGTVIGEQGDFVAAMDELPDGVRFELISFTTYSDAPGESMLTDRQREILELAVEEGYFDQPRRIDREEIADRLGLSGSTVSEHLRKAERKILTDYAE